jgi:preprotein translocase subunit YajC
MGSTVLSSIVLGNVDASAKTAAATTGVGGGSLQIVFLVVAVALVIFMVFNGRRNRAKQAALRGEMTPGSDIMTNFGLFGKLLSVDEVTNIAEVETSPGVIVRVHRQTLTKVVTPTEPADSDAPRSVEEAMERANREAAEKEAAAKVEAEAPEYGERVDDDPITKATTKRAPRAPKNTDD